MPVNSRAKGKRGELELAAFLRAEGYDARRGQQFSGGADSPDVVGLPGVHVECKRQERIDLYGFMDQAVADCGGKVPVVFLRRNGRQWLVCQNAADWIRMYRATGMGIE